MQTRIILLVDDNAVQAAARQAILKRNGYFVITVLNPTFALEQFRSGELPPEVHLVITDHLMPGMSGSQFAREIRNLRPQIPILVISGLEEAEDEYRGLNVEFRMKPLQPEHLLACVQQMTGAAIVDDDSAIPLVVTAPA
jgi:CheY-like chemotaxis protein